MKWKIVLRLYLVVGALGIAFYLKEHPNDRELIYSPDRIHVKIQGFVKNPGVYKLVAGQTLKDLVEVAGGFLPGTETRFQELDLDQLLYDGQVIDLEKR